ncbi:hypothetical protein IC232_26250 [Microvirga sp. BT688]|uniref:hypothetical protein n=1 Tax=Microvirga sp. TaxID=1873136 RepID=UPI0016863EC7|nr:hypothetical protein [Microvirga sp.]MBD2750172.1 hypothetical protein [Microvirga sp.]
MKDSLQRAQGTYAPEDGHPGVMSRRRFLYGSCLTAVAVAVDGFRGGSNASAGTNLAAGPKGKIKSGIVVNGVVANEYPFKNFIKGGLIYSEGGRIPIPAFVDGNGYPVSPPPGAGGQYGIHVYLPPSYTGRWVLKWRGTGRIRILPANYPSETTDRRIKVHSGSHFVITGTSSEMTASGTDVRVEFTLNGRAPEAFVWFPSDGTYAEMADLVLCRSADEAAIDAGEWFTSEYIAKIRDLNPRALRTVDWGSTNGNLLTHHSLRAPLSAMTVAAEGWLPAKWIGDISGTNSYSGGSYQGDFPQSWAGGETFHGRFVNTNTSQTVTIDVGRRGAKSIVTPYNTPPEIGAIAAGTIATFVYDEILDRVIWQSNGLTRGVPLELHVRLSNELQLDLWYCLPGMIDDTSVVEMTRYIRDTLDPGLTLYLEYSNEIWNFAYGFPQTSWANARGNRLGIGGWNNYYALRYREIMGLVTDTWTPRSTASLRRVNAVHIAGWVDGFDRERFRGEGVRARGYDAVSNRPIDYTDVISYATYYAGAQCSPEWTYENDLRGLLTAADQFASKKPALMESALDWIDNDIRAGRRNGAAGGETLETLRAQYDAWLPVATAHGKPIICYEGGLEIMPPTEARLVELGHSSSYRQKIANLISAYKRDSRCHKLASDQFEQMRARSNNGGPAWYLMGRTSPWSLLEGDLFSPGWMTYHAAKNFNAMQRGGE